MELMGRTAGSKSLTDTEVAPSKSFTKSLVTPQRAPMSEGARARAKVRLNCILETYGDPGSYVPKDATAFVHRGALFTFECSLGNVNGTLKDTPEVGHACVHGMIDSVVKNMPEDWD